MRRLFFTLLATFAAIQLSAQTSPKFITTIEGISEYELSNGLKVLLMPDQTQTNVIVNMVYKVGSRHEGYGEKGMAHLLEHMLFKQGGRFANIQKSIADKGALANGTTSMDRTNYYEMLPGNDENLRWALDMEADRMVNAKILQEELNKEFSVVRNEFEKGENNSFAVLYQRVISAMYLWHNYGKSTIGSKEDIERVKAQNLKTFYKKFYQPDNAVLVIGGKFNQQKALNYVQELFGTIPKPKRVLDPTYTVEPVQDGERMVELRRTGDVQYFMMAFHTPAAADEDYAPIAILAEMLINNPSGVFYKRLVETKLATEVECGVTEFHEPGYTYFYAKVPIGGELNTVKKVYLAAADSIGMFEMSEEDLARAKAYWKNISTEIENNTQKLSIEISESIGAGDWRLWFLNRDRIENVKVSDLERVANRYFKKSNRTYGLFIPDDVPDRTVVNERPDITKILADYKGKTIKASSSNFENSIVNIRNHAMFRTLPNGGQYALLEKPAKGDKIFAVIRLRFGDEKSLSDKSQVGYLMAQMLKTGTTNRTKQQISDELNRIQSTITFSDLSQGFLSIQLSTDKVHLSEALNLLDDLLKNPKFDSHEFDKLVLQTKTTYESKRQDPQIISNQRLRKITSPYVKGHPLYFSDINENLDDLGNVTLEDIKKYYNDFYGANHSISVFVGGIDQEVVSSFLNKTFGDWNSKMNYARINPIYFETKSTTENITTPDKANAQLMGIINLSLSQKSPDYPALFMANYILGGGTFLGSRIAQRLREKEGLSYNTGSTLNSSYDVNQSTWLLHAIFNPIAKDKLHTALMEEIDKAIKDGFTQEELTKGINAFLETQKSLLGMDSFIAGTIGNYMDDNRDLSDFDNFQNKIKALTLAEVNNAMRKYFDKSKLVLVYAGDFDKKQ